MSTLTLSVVSLGALASLVAFGAPTVRASDDVAVRAPLESYIKGHATGDPSFIRNAFHAEARIMAIRDGKFLSLSVEEFASRFTGKPAEDEAKRRRAIEAVDVNGNAAAARIVLDYPSVRFTDYMSLLRFGAEWKIVNKVFVSEPK